jgi:maltose-binding protein MalE
MMHAIDTPTATNNPDAAAWLIPGFEPGPASAGVIASAEAGAKPYPMIPQMGILHEALGTELADFMAGRETAEQALADVQGSYEAAARTQGFLE